jgi:hypothetical protein
MGRTYPVKILMRSKAQALTENRDLNREFYHSIRQIKSPVFAGWALVRVVVDVQERIAIRSHRLQKFPHRPHVVRDPGSHGGRHSQTLSGWAFYR